MEFQKNIKQTTEWKIHIFLEFQKKVFIIRSFIICSRQHFFLHMNKPNSSKKFFAQLSNSDDDEDDDDEQDNEDNLVV